MAEKQKKTSDSNIFQSIMQWYKKRSEKKRKKREASKKSKVREYVEAILVAFVAAMILRILVVQAFRIPTGSMKDTLLVGDFLLVNKFIYGVRTPEYLPVLNKKIPYGRLPGFKDPQPGDIVVFKYPIDKKLDYIKRCIATAGQTIEMRNGHVYVDGKPEGKSEFVRRVYDPDEYVYVLKYKITKDNGKSYEIRLYENSNPVSNNFGPLQAGNGRTVEIRPGQVFIDGKPGGKAELLNKAYQEKKGQYRLRYLITDENGTSFEIDTYQEVQPSTVNANFDPLWVPKKGEKGSKIKIRQENFHYYQRVFEEYEKKEVNWKQGLLYVNDKPLNEYTFKQDYFFMMGDNRDNSADSRSWGFLPRNNVVGQALIIYFSWDQSIPFYKFFKKVRWARIGDLIH
jgi:signal peptidase I